MGNKKCKRVDTIFREKRTNKSRVYVQHDEAITDISESWDIICRVHQELEDEGYDIGLLEEEDMDRLQTKLMNDDDPDIDYYIKLMKVCINVRKAKLNDKPVMKCDKPVVKCDKPVRYEKKDEPVKYEKIDEPVKYEKKCANACRDKRNCFRVRQYFTCDHYHCLWTTYDLEHCAVCKCNEWVWDEWVLDERK